jgi:hypothetical protein
MRDPVLVERLDERGLPERRLVDRIDQLDLDREWHCAGLDERGREGRGDGLTRDGRFALYDA